MENVILIRITDIADIGTPDENIFVLNEATGDLYRGVQGVTPIKILDENTPTFYANQFMFL